MKNRPTAETPFVDFYSQHGISPVSQDVSDLSRHFGRRRGLYAKLGLPPALFKGRNILEFGPGSGHNALYTLSLGPALFHLVDGNPTGLEAAKERLGVCNQNIGAELEYELCLFDDFESARSYDVVLSEGLLVYQKNPAGLARKLAAFTIPGGVFVGTCADSVSILSDLIRRLLAQAGADHCLSLKERAEALAPYFESHFKNLPGMSRPIVDWLLDNAFQPFYGEMFSLAEAVTALEEGFIVFQSSPSFAADWRWYKDITQPDQAFNEAFKIQYRQNIHNLLDFRVRFEPRDENENTSLLHLCDEIFKQVKLYQSDYEDSAPLLKISDLVGAASENVGAIGPKADASALALKDAAAALKAVAGKKSLPDCGRFTSFFGRGQQYISFIKI